MSPPPSSIPSYPPRLPQPWLAAAVPLVSAASLALGRAAPFQADGVTRTAVFVLALTAAAMASGAIQQAARGRTALTLPGAAAAATAAISCGLLAGRLSWPAPVDAAWLFATASALSTVSATGLARLALTSASPPPLRGAISTPVGIAVVGMTATGVAWMGPGAVVGSRRFSGRPGHSLLGMATLLWFGLLIPLLQRRWPVLPGLRGLHGAEHVAVAAALEGHVPRESASLLGRSPISLYCGSTVLVFAVPLWALTAHIDGLAGALALLWVLGWSVTLRALANQFPGVRWALAPALWLQRLTTAPPSRHHLAVALAAVRAAL